MQHSLTVCKYQFSVIYSGAYITCIAHVYYGSFRHICRIRNIDHHEPQGFFGAINNYKAFTIFGKEKVQSRIAVSSVFESLIYTAALTFIAIDRITIYHVVIAKIENMSIRSFDKIGFDHTFKLIVGHFNVRRANTCPYQIRCIITGIITMLLFVFVKCFIVLKNFRLNVFFVIVFWFTVVISFVQKQIEVEIVILTPFKCLDLLRYFHRIRQKQP